MFSRVNHPYIQIDDTYVDIRGNPDYDTGRKRSSSYKDGPVELQDFSDSKPTKRHSYAALATPEAYPDSSTSPLRSNVSKDSLRPPSDIYKQLPAPPRSRWSGWRFTVASGCVTAIFVFICNISLLGWSHNLPLSKTNNLLLFEGSCPKTKTTDTVVHLIINVLSTLLLGASNYAMQVLVAPTRENIDAAHPKGRTLDIGISGFNNWGFIGWKRRILWISLTLSTIPLHLLYNSVIFSTTSAVDYDAWLVTSDFLTTSSAQNRTSTSSGTTISDDDRVRNLINNNGNFTRLDTADCISVYNQNFVSDNALAILFTDVTVQQAENNSVITTFGHSSTAKIPDLNWMCDRQGSLEPCGNIDPSNWVFPTGYTQTEQVKVQYCMSMPVEPQCTLELVPALLYTVIVCNVIKAVAFAILVFLQFDPLITIGQAVASFLDNPDATTAGLGAYTARDVRGKWLSTSSDGTYFTELNQDHIYKPERRRWFSGAAPSRWAWTLLACCGYWFVGMGLLIGIQNNSNTPSFASQWANGFGNALPSEMAGDNVSGAAFAAVLLGNVLAANIPQIVLSLVYVSYNGCFTCMLLSFEFNSFASKRKGLRVHWPRGSQRSTYWLSLPYRYSMPLLVASGLLHWLLSQTIFVAQINVFNAQGVSRVSQNAIGWSGLSLTLLLALGGTMILTLIGFGFFRYGPGMPVTSSDSRAISAACHPAPGRFMESTEKLQYGVISDLGDGIYHVGFSSGEVRPLIAGEHYE